MVTFRTGYKWLDNLMPDGLPIPSSSLVSGPGGTGKPLVIFAFVSAWLKEGGSIIGIPLQYPSPNFVDAVMRKLYSLNIEKYGGRFAYIHFDPTFTGVDLVSDNTVRANLLKPKVWDEALNMADKLVEETDLGTMVFGSALNLLLFSPTYRGRIIKRLEELISKDKSRTYLFSVSTSAFKDLISAWEIAADNLMLTRMERPMKLFFRILRMKDVAFSSEEVRVPISEEMLNEIKMVAEKNRSRMIPIISKV